MDAGDYVKFILALLFVLSLIGLLATVLRRLGIGTPHTPFKRAEDKRLGLVEVMPIDPKRRLVLLRRDGVEHLVILGATGETLVETNITPPPPKRPYISSALEPASVLSHDSGDDTDSAADNASQKDQQP